jgi:phosphate-selective porin
MRRLTLGLVGVLALLGCAGSAGAQAAKADPKTAAVPVMKQLEAFRRDDFETAFTFASGAIRAQFDRPSFETMVRRGYPEIARSAFAAVVKAELESEGVAYVTVKIRGANGQSIEALYELTWEDDWKISGVVTRPDAGII